MILSVIGVAAGIGAMFTLVALMYHAHLDTFEEEQ